MNEHDYLPRGMLEDPSRPVMRRTVENVFRRYGWSKAEARRTVEAGIRQHMQSPCDTGVEADLRFLDLELRLTRALEKG